MCFVELPESHQRVFHSIVHVKQNFGVECSNERAHLFAHTLDLRQFTWLNGSPRRHLQMSDDAFRSGQKSVAAHHQ